MAHHHNERKPFSRRSLLKGFAAAPFFFRAAPFLGCSPWLGLAKFHAGRSPALPFADVRFLPHYPAQSPVENLFGLVVPGSDEFVTEKFAYEIGLLLQRWSQALQSSTNDFSALAAFLDPACEISPLTPAQEHKLRIGGGLETRKRQFAATNQRILGRERVLHEIRNWLGHPAKVQTAEFEITAIEEISDSPISLRLNIRYDLVAELEGERREERVGSWLTEWRQSDAKEWKIRKWEAGEETVSEIRGPAFVDVTGQAMAAAESYSSQLLHGTDYWRTVLDGACGIDVYGNNGVSVGDFDNDGFDDLYVCQPAGLPNRLYRNRGDGTFEDVTEKSGVGVLDNTACALFADFGNKGVQDLLVVCGSGPLLFLNQGNGTFSLKRDAFKFKKQPQGTFTHAAIADYDRDGRLDIYFCLYSYYLGLDQYHYPVPYFDARNGPPNYLMRNHGDGTFEDQTEAAGLNAENDRYSFACAWGDYQSNGLPDLYVANDFGRSNLYRNNGDGTFAAVSEEAQVQDAGAGMSAAWSDIDNDGKPDIYAANMWSAAGQRVSQQKNFHEKAPENIRALYRRHARGNSLYRNQGDGKFQNESSQIGVEMGRWSWCSDFWDFDHDGYPDLYVANGYISGPRSDQGNLVDLGSFFWRQVVAKSPDDTTPSQAYEHGWNALNELIRSDGSWSGYERNVMFANNRDGTFSEVSGTAGLDLPEDSRSFALADLDHDGRLEVILKNRNAPQLRILHNNMQDIGKSIAFRLRGTKSNRDAIGAAITMEAGSLRQTRYLQAGSGFLAQHTKEVHIGVGKYEGAIRATVRWPNGTTQQFENLPAGHRIEIEEGASTFKSTPFAASPAASAKQVPASSESLPSQVETWLLEPLKAPEFSLPDLVGNTRSLQSLQGSFLLLNFWSTKSPQSSDQLRTFQQQHTALTAAHCEVLALNVDEASDLHAAQATTSQAHLSFPVVFATEEVAGIYNIIFRFLFDRRKDLPIPCTFLLDREGMIVKIYQGPVEPSRVLDDLRAIPANPKDRIAKALPFGGVLYQSALQRNDFTYGIALLQHGYLDQATASFQQVLAAKPDDPEACYNLGTLYLRRNDLDQAKKYLERTVALRADYPEAWNNLGMIAAQQGRTDDAVQSFQQSLQQRPSYAIALVNLGNLYRRQGAFDKAQDLLTRAHTLQPDDPEIDYGLGMLYAQQGQIQQASGYLQKAIALRPDYPEARNNLGILYVRAQNYAEAEEQFKTCIQLVPNFDQSYLNLARLYAMRGDREGAIAMVQELLRLQPENRGALQAMEALR
jgi:Flp pilus assembly protein TadD/peroxiredoxin